MVLAQLERLSVQRMIDIVTRLVFSLKVDQPDLIGLSQHQL